MTLRDSTDRSQSEALAFEFTLAHPPEKVWRALTDPALLSQWLLPVYEFQLAAGTAFTFRTDAQPGWDGVVHCRMLEADAPRRLRYAWVVGELDTTVTFTLTPTATGTQVLLVQSGFTPPQKPNFGGARYGWRMMGERLIALLDSTP